MQVSRRCEPRQGATLVLIALLMVVLVGMVAFAVEVGRMYLVRSQLQTAVDAGSLAAALQLRDDNTDVDAAVAAANTFVQYNRVGWMATVPDDAIAAEAGTWDPDTRQFTAGGEKPDAVRVFATQEDEPLMFASVLGQSKFSTPAQAIAVAGGEPMDIIMTLDLSKSMEKNGRIEALQNAAPVFVDAIEEVGDDDRIGIFGYGAEVGKYDPEAEGDSGTLYTLTPQDLFPDNDDWVGVLEAVLTDDFDYLRAGPLSLSSLTADKYNGWTPIGAAIRDSAHYLDNNARADVKKIIVLMSDGQANRPVSNANDYALSMATYADGLDITIYTISLGDAADDDLMQEIADLTGGSFFKAKGSASKLEEQLKEAFRHISAELKRTQLVQ